MNKRRVINFLFVFGFFLLLTFFFSTGSLFYALIAGKGVPSDVWRDFRFYGFQWIPWAFFTPLITRLVRRYPLQGRGCLKTVPLHLMMCLILSFIQSFLRYFNAWVYNLGYDFSTQMLMLEYVNAIHLNFLTYWLIIAVYYWMETRRKHRENELKASRLETQLTQAQLEVLKMQLHPHFLFNTLHAISALVHKNPKAADKMISLLSDLLRMSLDNSSLQEVPLKEEVAFLKTYLSIEKTRFEDRLTVKMDIDPDTLDAVVPNFILQPLVENAIRHGISPRKTGGCIEILSIQDNGVLRIDIRDNGMGFPNGDPANGRKGIGLANTRERLIQLYGAEHRFFMGNITSGGALVSLEIPLRKSAIQPEKQEE